MATTKRRLTKPKSVSSDPWRSKKWNEIVRGHDFGPEDVAALTLLVQWYQVVDQCIEDISVAGGGIRVAQEDGRGEMKAMPQLATMQKASAEIRQLCKQLGMKRYHDESTSKSDEGDKKQSTDDSADFLKLIQGKARKPA